MLTPKSVELTKVVVKQDDEDLSMEVMMIESMANIQLEQLKKKFKEKSFKTENLMKKLPPVVQCFGLKITDLDIIFKKSQV